MWTSLTSHPPTPISYRVQRLIREALPMQILPTGIIHVTHEPTLLCSFIFLSFFFFKLSISLHSKQMLLPWLWLIPTYFILNAKYLISSVVHSARWTHYKVKLNISQMWSTLSSRFSNLILNLIMDRLLVVGTGAATWMPISYPIKKLSFQYQHTRIVPILENSFIYLSTHASWHWWDSNSS